MSDVNPTNSKSYRPGDERKGYNDLVTIVLTKRDCSDLLTAMNELTLGRPRSIPTNLTLESQ